jgi:hypothetical protein
MVVAVSRPRQTKFRKPHSMGSDVYCASKAAGDILKGDMTLRRPNA